MIGREVCRMARRSPTSNGYQRFVKSMCWTCAATQAIHASVNITGSRVPWSRVKELRTQRER
jgi:hypothetical protein